jgi:hypothetical protein
MLKIKLTDQEMRTYGGFQWGLGEKRIVEEPGTELCEKDLFHYYETAEQAVLFNPVHANIQSPRIFEVEVDREVAFDGLKGGCHEMTLLRELELPVFTMEQRVEFAIKCAMRVYQEPGFVKWAGDWLTGKDRSVEAARAAGWAAASVMTGCVDWAAVTATCAATKAAVWAVGWSSRLGVQGIADWAAVATSATVTATARAAEAAAEAGFYDFQPIIEELKCQY